MNEDRLKEILKQAVNMTQATNPTTHNPNGSTNTINYVKFMNTTPTIQRTDNVYKKRGN